ncbi:putative bulb-type lectin domain superfamily [Helianthus annuus]|nr:putative bulb-type lectin domain superfamily [Helianthus annuus]
MQDSRNFVLYDSTGTRVLWQTFEHPTNTLLAGQSLKPGQTLFSSVSETDQSIGVFRLDMQFDGILCYTRIEGKPQIKLTGIPKHLHPEPH